MVASTARKTRKFHAEGLSALNGRVIDIEPRAKLQSFPSVPVSRVLVGRAFQSASSSHIRVRGPRRGVLRSVRLLSNSVKAVQKHSLKVRNDGVAYSSHASGTTT